MSRDLLCGTENQCHDFNASKPPMAGFHLVYSSWKSIQVLGDCLHHTDHAGPIWNTVPAFGILSSSTILTPLRSYIGRTSNMGCVASMTPPASLSSLWNLAVPIGRPVAWSVVCHYIRFCTDLSTSVLSAWILSNLTELLEVFPIHLNYSAPGHSRSHHNFWNTTIFRTIPQWNQLPASIAETDSLFASACMLVAVRATASTHPLGVGLGMGCNGIWMRAWGCLGGSMGFGNLCVVGVGVGVGVGGWGGGGGGWRLNIWKGVVEMGSTGCVSLPLVSSWWHFF